MKRHIALTVTAVGVMALFGCGSNEPTSQKTQSVPTVEPTVRLEPTATPEMSPVQAEITPIQLCKAAIAGIFNGQSLKGLTIEPIAGAENRFEGSIAGDPLGYRCRVNTDAESFVMSTRDSAGTWTSEDESGDFRYRINGDQVSVYGQLTNGSEIDWGSFDRADL